MKINIILMIVGITVVDSCCGADLHRLLRLKRAETDFILRSCTASAELIRKHRTNDPAELAEQRSNAPKLTAASLVLDNSKNNDSNLNSNNIRDNLRSRTRSSSRHLVDKITTDTPLGTVDIKTITQDIPKTFKKKDPLPELDRNGAARQLDTDTPIIVVQPLKH